jgi:hypothetical protein
LGWVASARWRGPKKTEATISAFPARWTVEDLDGGFKIVDANKQTLAYVYGHADPRDAQVAKALTLD